MKALELRIPPPLVMVAVALLMLAAARLMPSLTFALPGKGVWAALIAVLGIAVAGAGVLSFRRAKTTVNPMRVHATASLVTSGVFRISRNPMYLGMVLLLIAWAVHLANAAAFLILPLFVVYITCFQIAPEERSMEKLFGNAFVAYTKATRRWL
ncbi:MAG: methyltransferase family protein [Burkholderiaceae bacterium]